MKQYFAAEIIAPPMMAEAMAFRFQARGALGTAIQDPDAYQNLLKQGDATIFLDPDGVEDLGDDAKIHAWFGVSEGKVHLHDPHLNFLDVDPAQQFKEKTLPEHSFPPRTAQNILKRDVEEVAEIFDGKATVTFSWTKAEDWEEAWKKYFRVFDISPHVTICPSWLEAKERKDHEVITLDAGAAFGTGEHASTKLAARLIDNLMHMKERDRAWDILDLGCGSGILAMIAAKLGQSDDKILGLDIDPRAVKTAQDNVAQNDLQQIEIKVGELRDARGPYDLLIANLILQLHLELIDDYVDALKPSAYLIISGIVTERENEFLEALEGRPLTIEESLTDGAWSAWLLQKED